MTHVDICPPLADYFCWLCCLHPIESIPMAALIALRTAGMVDYIPVNTFNELWLVSGDPVDSPRYKQFIFVFYLKKLELEIGGEPVDVYQMLDPFWFKMLLFNGCPQRSCASGCFLLQYKNR